LDVSYDERKVKNQDVTVIVKGAKDKLSEKIDGEYDLITRFTNVLHHIAEIRNSRGEISHGKPLPMGERSSVQSAKSIKSFTDGFASYLLHLLLSIELPPPEKILYEDNPKFNSTLDEEYQLGIISYSKALYEQDYVAYEEELENYISELALEEV
jgi:hypothetical protein